MYIIKVSHTSHPSIMQARAMAEKIARFVKYMSRDETGPPVNQVAMWDETVGGKRPAPQGADVYVIVTKNIDEQEASDV